MSSSQYFQTTLEAVKAARNDDIDYITNLINNASVDINSVIDCTKVIHINLLDYYIYTHMHTYRCAIALINAGARINDVSKPSPTILGEKTVLMVACRYGLTDIARAAIYAGTADLNARTKGGNTVLMAACKSNNPELVQLLVEHGAKWGSMTLLTPYEMRDIRGQPLCQEVIDLVTCWRRRRLFVMMLAYNIGGTPYKRMCLDIFDMGREIAAYI